jgi:hypothetical protein
MILIHLDRSPFEALESASTRNVARGCDIVPFMGDESPEASPNYERDLGVIEAITYVTRSCPSGVVIAAAQRALDAIKQGGPDVIKQQAYFVLTALQGWRGERARQVHRSLTNYLELEQEKSSS